MASGSESFSGAASRRNHQTQGAREGADREPSRFAARANATTPAGPALAVLLRIWPLRTVPVRRTSECKHTRRTRFGRPLEDLAAANRDGSRSGGTDEAPLLW